MNNRRRRRLGIAPIAAGALALAGCSASPGGADGDGPISLTYAFFAPAASFPSIQMQEWADQLNERTDGQVEVELFVGGTLLSSGDIYEGVSQGIVDVGLDSPAYDTSRFPLSSVINVPMGIETPLAGSQTFLDLLLEYEPEEYADYEIITAFTTEASYLQTEQAMTSRSNLSGSSLRGAGALVPLLEDLGATPTGMSMAEVSESMSTGVIDGYTSSREVLKDFGLAESVDYVTDYPLGVSNSFVAVMDKEAFDALPQDVQDVILELREEMMLFASEIHAESVETSLDESTNDFGVEVVNVDPEEVEAWDAVLEDRAEAWVSENQGAPFDPEEVLDRARDLVAENS